MAFTSYFFLSGTRDRWAQSQTRRPDTLWMRFWMVSKVTVYRWKQTHANGQGSCWHPEAQGWRCGKMIIKHKELDLVLKSCDRLAAGPQMLLMLKWQKEPWMRLMHNSVETLWLNTHLLEYSWFRGVSAQPTDRAFSKNVRHCMMDVVWMGGS